MSVLFYPESIRILGSDASGNNIMLCEMAVDDIANLPAANAFISDGYVLSMGCKAIVINDNSVHRLNSAGQWVQIEAGTSTYTRAEIDAMQLDLQNQIDYSINTGAKNLFYFSSMKRGDSNYGTTVNTNGVNFILNGNGSIIANRVEQSSENAFVTLCSTTNISYIADAYCNGEYILSGCPAGGGRNTYSLYAAKGAYTRYDDGDGILLTDTQIVGISIIIIVYAGYNAQNLIFNPMIRKTAIIDPTFQPYAPTNRQLYEMILQLQGG